jgi:hypothetical protein
MARYLKVGLVSFLPTVRLRRDYLHSRKKAAFAMRLIQEALGSLPNLNIRSDLLSLRTSSVGARFQPIKD